MSEENEASSSKELVNRRTALQTLGLGAISSGISTLAAGSRKPEEEVRYPKLISGDEVVEYITVPKRWDEHRKQAQKVLDKIRAGLHNIPAVEETQLEASSESFGGVSGKKIVVLVNDVNADGIQNIPSKEGGIPIEVREMPRRQQGSKNCSDETSDDNCGNDEATSSVPGGYSFGEENKNKGSSCCEVIYNGKDRMLTVAHLFGDHCSNPENIVGTKASAGGTTVGKVTEFNQDEDWAIVDKSEGGSYLNYIQESSVPHKASSASCF
ncbi:hypothetical protein [Haloarcula sp. JP-L23]|uniref:hypothetical protein n=1 Tax=Haloarcula sp. JP-L23 TaxID=2716717 RepID=UPI00140EE462|nr:hypothetical protein G9465_22220 [Haloarcula sp. JP-L23]